MRFRTSSLWALGVCVVLVVAIGGCSREKPMPTPTATTESERPIPVATPTSLPVNTPVSAEKAHYVVQAGDTLWAIADRFGVTLDFLVEANELSDPERLQPGQEIVIPIDSDQATNGPSSPEPPSQESVNVASQRTHTVTAGENLWSIALRYGTTVDEVAGLNELDPDELLTIGQRLLIP